MLPPQSLTSGWWSPGLEGVGGIQGCGELAGVAVPTEHPMQAGPHPRPADVPRGGGPVILTPRLATGARSRPGQHSSHFPWCSPGKGGIHIPQALCVHLALCKWLPPG